MSTLSGAHLHMLFDPETVAAELIALLSDLGFASLELTQHADCARAGALAPIPEDGVRGA